MASSDAPPAAGSCVATTIVLAAGLAELTARVAGADELVERARELQRRCGPLGADDAQAYEAFLRERSEEARRQTIELPARMAELAADAAELCADAAAAGRGPVAADAAVGALLADAAARAALLLVRVNGGEEQRGPAGRAAEAARRALANV